MELNNQRDLLLKVAQSFGVSGSLAWTLSREQISIGSTYRDLYLALTANDTQKNGWIHYSTFDGAFLQWISPDRTVMIVDSEGDEAITLYFNNVDHNSVLEISLSLESGQFAVNGEIRLDPDYFTSKSLAVAHLVALNALTGGQLLRLLFKLRSDRNTDQAQLIIRMMQHAMRRAE